MQNAAAVINANEQTTELPIDVLALVGGGEGILILL
jgi:hypothetical protein